MGNNMGEVVYWIDFAWLAEHAEYDGVKLSREDIERVADRFCDLLFGEYNEAVGDLMHEIREQAMKDCGFEAKE